MILYRVQLFLRSIFLNKEMCTNLKSLVEQTAYISHQKYLFPVHLIKRFRFVFNCLNNLDLYSVRFPELNFPKSLEAACYRVHQLFILINPSYNCINDHRQTSRLVCSCRYTEYATWKIKQINQLS